MADNLLTSLKRGTFLVIRTDGTLQLFEQRPSVPAVRDAIGCKLWDTVYVGRSVGNDVHMLVDDDGYETEMVQHDENHFELKPIKARKPINPRATELYHAVCHPGTTHQIVGDVALVHDDDFA